MQDDKKSNFHARLERLARIIAMVVLCFHSAAVFALSDSDLDKFSANDIMFYDPDGRNCSGTPVRNREITYIGDSLSVQTLDSIKNAYSGIDVDSKTYDGATYDLVQPSKHFSNPGVDYSTTENPNYDGVTIASALASHNNLRKHLVFALGTNDPGSVSTTALDNLLTAVGTSTDVILVTNYGLYNQDGYAKNNENMRQYASSKSNVSVADWHTVAASEPEKYIDNSDNLGIHLTDEGKTAFIDVIKNAITTYWTSGVNDTASNTNYEGLQVWSDAELEMIEANKHVYVAAAQKYGIKWQLLATLHSAEHGLKVDNPDNGQGMYQLYSYTDAGTNANAFRPAGPVDEAEFIRQTDIAASIVVGIIKGAKLDLQSDAGAKRLLYQYNGLSNKYHDKAIAMGFSEEEANWGEGSSYVMNRFDARRDPTHPETMDPLWPGRYVADGKYDSEAVSKNFGTFVKYAALGGMSDNVCTSSFDSSTLISYVRRYAWPEFHSAPFLNRMPDYADAVAERVKKKLYVGGTVNNVQGIDCGGFVTTIMNESGFEPGYNYGGDKSAGASNVEWGQMPWVIEHPEKWELVNPDWNTPIPDESVLSPGDVAYVSCGHSKTFSPTCGHTYMYIGEVEGFETHIASASYSSNGTGGRAPMSGVEPIFMYGDEPVHWVHKK